MLKLKVPLHQNDDTVLSKHNFVMLHYVTCRHRCTRSATILEGGEVHKASERKRFFDRKLTKRE